MEQVIGERSHIEFLKRWVVRLCAIAMTIPESGVQGIRDCLSIP